MDPKQVSAEDIELIKVWFDRLKITMKQYSILSTDCYNMNEIGFQEGQECAE
ncbi:predicted protein [Histoplasma mississippiense (nom. inval.)]|uniref:predicted protein n=1 Tax=Ajellomyces capsulatus (strain NAm1 / WU24) TaxID=2059318 RepID=UPI000157C367|nr:predicted protein [Histoplasma mississippiense (nom. inval.)]EDN07926.1 predicted protein [Histoplasma mississippiense (nom. inval.)]